MKFIIFVFLICILFYLNSKKKIREHLVNNKKKWNNYRLGDLIKGECYRKPREKKYFFSIYKLFPNSIADEYIKKTNHLKNKEIVNELYLDKIEEIIKRRGILTIRKFSGNPDEDFIFMSNAKNFVSSNGYFSLFVSKIVERNNGLVLKSDGVK